MSEDGSELHRYWTQGEGLARWTGERKPYVALHGLLLSKGMRDPMAARVAAAWFNEVVGHWPAKHERSAKGRKSRAKVKESILLVLREAANHPPPYEWSHGWKPLTPRAAAIKAHKKPEETKKKSKVKGEFEVGDTIKTNYTKKTGRVVGKRDDGEIIIDIDGVGELSLPPDKISHHGDDIEVTEPAKPAEPAEPAVKKLPPSDMKKLPSDEQQAVYDYSGQGHGLLNNSARGTMEGANELSDEDFDEIARISGLLDQAVNKSKLPGEIKKLYRGTSYHDPDLKPGSTITDPAWSSTSTDREEATGFAGKDGVILEIDTSGGGTGLWVGGPEGEAILPRNAQFRVDSVTTDKNGRRVAKVTLINKGTESVAPAVDHCSVTRQNVLAVLEAATHPGPYEWKHGWVPLTARAAKIKSKQLKGSAVGKNHPKRPAPKPRPTPAPPSAPKPPSVQKTGKAVIGNTKADVHPTYGKRVTIDGEHAGYIRPGSSSTHQKSSVGNVSVGQKVTKTFTVFDKNGKKIATVYHKDDATYELEKAHAKALKAKESVLVVLEAATHPGPYQWRHGWIPLTARAKAIKAHKLKVGSSARGKKHPDGSTGGGLPKTGLGPVGLKTKKGQKQGDGPVGMSAEKEQALIDVIMGAKMPSKYTAKKPTAKKPVAKKPTAKKPLSSGELKAKKALDELKQPAPKEMNEPPAKINAHGVDTNKIKPGQMIETKKHGWVQVNGVLDIGYLEVTGDDGVAFAASGDVKQVKDPVTGLNKNGVDVGSIKKGDIVEQWGETYTVVEPPGVKPWILATNKETGNEVKVDPENLTSAKTYTPAPNMYGVDTNAINVGDTVTSSSGKYGKVTSIEKDGVLKVEPTDSSGKFEMYASNVKSMGPPPGAKKDRIPKTTKPDDKHRFPLPANTEYGSEAYRTVIDAPDLNLTKAEKNAIAHYTGNGYKVINSHLRSGMPLNSINKVSRSIKALDGVFERTPPLEKQVRVSRSVKKAELIFGPVGSNVGGVFSDKAFVSTTSEHREAFKPFFGEAKITMDLPPGVKAIVPDGAGTFGDGEHEVLLPRGMAFEIVADNIQDGKRNIHLRAVVE